MQAQHFAAILVLFLSVQKGCTQTIIVGEVPPSPPSPFPALFQDLQAQLSSTLATGTPINLLIPSGTIPITQSLLIDLTNATQPVPVTITGQGANSTVISCQGRAIPAIVIKNASATSIAGLTVQNCGGELAGVGGGGVYLETTGDITVTRCVFTAESAGNGVATGTNIDGAGIRLSTPLYATGIANVQIANCSFTGNQGQRGAGISARGVAAVASITNCTFQANRAVNGSAVAVNGWNAGRIDIQGCSFLNGTVSKDGGAVHYWDSTAPLSISSSVFLGNAATTQDSNGGGLHVEGNTGPVTMTNCSFTGNTARWGGAVLGNEATGNLTFVGCSFQGNRVQDTGGAIYAYSMSGAVSFTACNFTSNQAQLFYGGAFGSKICTGQTTFTSCRFENNTADNLNNGAGLGAGGALSFFDGPRLVSITGCTFVDNRARTSYGGAIGIVGQGPNLSISRTTFTGNSAAFGGAIGGTPFSSGSLLIDSCQFTQNNVSQFGGGICYHNTSTAPLTIKQTLFQGNIATNLGGGVHLQRVTGGVTIVDTQFRDNQCVRNQGGGVSLFDMTANVSFTNCVFERNAAARPAAAGGPGTIWGSGGGLFVGGVHNMSLAVKQTSFTNNTAMAGGGLAIDGDAAYCASVGYDKCAPTPTGVRWLIQNSTFQGNNASDGGGGMRFNDLKALVITDTVFDSNRATQGGGFWAQGSGVVTLQRTTFVNNVASNCSAVQSSSNATLNILINTTLPTQTSAASTQCYQYTNLSFASPPPSSSPPLTTPTPTPTPTPTTESSSSSNNNLGVIIGAAVGGVVGAALLGGVVAWLIVRKRGSKEPAQGGHKEGASAQRSGDIGSAASGAAVWAQQAATGSQSLKSPSAVSPTHPDAEVVVVTSPATTEQMLTTRKTQGVGLTGSTGVTTNTSQLSVGSRQAPVSASQPGSAFKAQSVSASGAFQDRPQSASGSGLRGYSSALGGPPSSVDSYSVYQREMLARLQIPWSALKLGRVIGQGGFGVVYQGRWQGTDVAVKTFDSASAENRHDLQREALAMCELRNPYIAHIYGLVDDGPHCALVMKYYKGGTVSDLIANPDYHSVRLSYRLRLAWQVVSGMRSLHERNIVHGDLKTANLLIDRDGRNLTCILTDFGLSVFAGQTLASTALTSHISPPEVLRAPRAPRTQAGDVYAFGIVLLEIVTGRAAYQGMHRDDIRRLVLDGRRPAIPDSVPEEILNLIRMCWAEDPSTRPSFADIESVLEREESEGVVMGVGGHTTMTATVSATTTTIEWPWAEGRGTTRGYGELRGPSRSSSG